MNNNKKIKQDGLMGIVIDTTEIFRRHARNLPSYRVTKAGNLHDHVLLNLTRINSDRVCKMVAVPLDDFTGFRAQVGDIVRIRETSYTYGQFSMGIAQYTVVSYIEKMTGEVDFSSRGKFITHIYAEDPNHPVNTIWKRQVTGPLSYI